MCTALQFPGCCGPAGGTGTALGPGCRRKPGGGNPDKVCQGDQKIEGRFNHNYEPGNGIQISEICIKAGPEKFEASCGVTSIDDCYTVEWGDNCESVMISGGGTGRDCKDISHTTATFGGVAPPLGSITIRKVSDESLAGPDFAFEVERDSDVIASTAIAIDGEAKVADLEPGVYVITEEVPAFWSLADISCDSGDPQRAGDQVTVTLRSPDALDVTCTFRNEPQTQ